MIISEEQVRRALEYLQTTEKAPAAPGSPGGGVPEELIERVRDIVAATPETRDDRVERGREMIAGGVSSSEVAEKMIGRIISDSIR